MSASITSRCFQAGDRDKHNFHLELGNVALVNRRFSITSNRLSTWLTETEAKAFHDQLHEVFGKPDVAVVSEECEILKGRIKGQYNTLCDRDKTISDLEQRLEDSRNIASRNFDEHVATINALMEIAEMANCGDSRDIEITVKK